MIDVICGILSLLLLPLIVIRIAVWSAIEIVRELRHSNKHVLIGCMCLMACMLNSGCATSFRIQSQMPDGIYPATRLDVWIIPEMWHGNVGTFEAIWLTPVAIIDIPISIVTDTIRLPVDIYNK